MSSTNLVAKCEPKTQPRIHGFDAARGIAIIGMIAAHLTLGPVPTLGVEHGFPSALFAVLAGVTMSLVMSRGVQLGGEAVLRARARMWARGAIIFAIGLLLTVIAPGIAVVLMAVALIFVFLAPLTYWSTKAVVLVFLGLWLFGGLVNAVVETRFIGSQLLSSPYPLMAWLSYGAFGVLVHRLMTHRLRWQIGAVVLGAPLAAVGVWLRYSASMHAGDGSVKLYSSSADEAASSAMGSMSDMRGVDAAASALGQEKTLGESVALIGHAWLDSAEHSGGILDVLFSCAMASAVIALMLLLCRSSIGLRLLWPLRALGSMALTSYVLHGVSVAPMHMLAAVGVQIPEAADPVKNPDYLRLPWDEYRGMLDGVHSWEEYRSMKMQYWDRVDALYFDNPMSGGSLADTSLSASDGPFVFLDQWGGVLTIAVLLVFACVWKWRFRRGPLEALVTLCEQCAVREQLPPRQLVAGTAGRAAVPDLPDEPAESDEPAVLGEPDIPAVVDTLDVSDVRED